MHRRKRPLKYLLFSLITLLALSAIIITIPPDKVFPVLSVQIAIMPIFFVLLFLLLFSAGTYLFKSRMHGVLIASVVLVYLVFRQNNLTHPIFAVLLLALFLVLELLFTYRK